MKYSFLDFIKEQFVTLDQTVVKNCDDVCDGNNEDDKNDLDTKAKKRKKSGSKYHAQNLLKYIKQHNIAQ